MTLKIWGTRRAIVTISAFLLFYICFGLYLFFNQEKIVYVPSNQDFYNCSFLPDAEAIEYNGTRMYIRDMDKKVVVLYHGNAGSACDRYFYANIFSEAGYGYVLVEYTGYSNDNEEPSHENVKQDVENVVEYLSQESAWDALVVGESIGTGAATYHTSRMAPEGLLLISPFTDLHDVAKDRFWFYPISRMVDNAFDNALNLRGYRGTTTIIHGSNDKIISQKLGRKLFSSLNGKREFISITDAGHNDLFFYPATLASINLFLSRP